MILLELLDELKNAIGDGRGQVPLIGSLVDVYQIPITVDGAPAAKVEFVYHDNVLVAVDITSE